MRSPNLYRSPNEHTVYRVRVSFLAGTYAVTRDGITFHYPTTTSQPPAIVFECSSRPPTDNTRPVTITGTVAGVIRDGHRRSASVDWQVIVRDCHVTQPLPPGQ